MLQGDISAAVSQLLTRHLLNPTDPNRQIAGFTSETPDFGVSVNAQFSYKNLLDAVTALCDPADLGIKTVWNAETRIFTVTLYRGTVSEAVFSKDYENLNEQTYIQSYADCGNLALVGGEGEGIKLL